jgi:hypothetical protein
VAGVPCEFAGLRGEIASYRRCSRR